MKEFFNLLAIILDNAKQCVQMLNNVHKLCKFIANIAIIFKAVDQIIKAITNGSAADIKLGNITYTIVKNSDGSLSIKLSEIAKGTTKIEIPSEIRLGNTVYPITEIYKSCFKDNKTLKEVIVGNNITKIGDSAFSGCTALEKVTLKEGLITIGKNAFYNCSKLKTIKTPSTLQTIGEKAFNGCKKISSVTIPAKVMKINKNAFYKCSKLKKVTVKSKVLSTVGKGAFKKCKKGIKFHIPKSRNNAYRKLLKGKF